MPLEFIDSHAHLSSEELFPQVEGLLERAKHAQVKAIINICTDLLSLEKGFSLNCPWVYHTGATTPHDVDKWGAEHFPFFAKFAEEKRLVAIGETGLDYYYAHSDKENQKKFFIDYLHLALKHELPLVIHCREAFKDLFEILDAEYLLKPGARSVILHCFTGSLEEAKEALKRGCYISFSGIVTFKKSMALRETAAFIPLERLLIETDSPYLAPQSHRGQVNEPAFVPEVAQMIAETKDVPLEIVAQMTYKNAKTIFKI